MVPLQSLGSGVAAGGVATYLIGGRMPALSQEGAMMKAQLAAYRRTLAATFDAASSLEDTVGTQACRGSRRPTRRSSGGWRSACGARSRR